MSYLRQFVEEKLRQCRDDGCCDCGNPTWNRVLLALDKSNQHHEQDRASNERLMVIREKILALQTLDDWDREMLEIIEGRIT